MKEASIFDVLSGKESAKVKVSVDILTIALLGTAIFIAVLAGVVIARKIS